MSSCQNSFEQKQNSGPVPLCHNKKLMDWEEGSPLSLQAATLCIDDTPTYSVGTVGDSISRAFLADGRLADAPLLNWSSGIDLAKTNKESHLNRLIDLATSNNFHIRAANVAVSGARIQSLPQQVLSLKSQPRMVYATVLMGINNLCQDDITEAQFLTDFEGRMEASLRLFLDPQHFPTPPLVLVSSLPDVSQLFSLPALRDNSQCQVAWNLGCPNWQGAMLASTWASMNQAISRVVTRINHRHIVYDNGALAGQTFSASHVSSVDCFHPSQEGQELISETLWNAIDIENDYRDLIPF
ncbi:MAG: hypothetical protein H6624_06005 [Bdellovibrionaceae bacterium]|nr:hypothetical protein [Bdellovibrionales bacterium]MCB9083876.1 hypothetical protein [Pseudobdellovibrionaceae bacterium]